MRIIFVFPMRKFFATISVLVYFAFTSGVIINTHYCMDRLDSVRLYAAKSDYCPKCGMHTKNGCCHDEITVVKIKADQKTSSIDFSLEAPVPFAIITSHYLSAGIYNNYSHPDHLNHSPPLLTGQDTYLQNCVFRI